MSQESLKREAERLRREREAKDPLTVRYGCTAYFLKSSGLLVEVGHPLDPPRATEFKLVRVDRVFPSQMAAENWLRECYLDELLKKS